MIVNAIFVGGGPAGLAPLLWAARQGTLRELASRGVVVVERTEKIGAGCIGRYAIGSDTLAETFTECVEDGAESRLTDLIDHPAAQRLSAYRGGAVPLPLAASFLDTLGETLCGVIRSSGGQILTGCEALYSQRRADGIWQTRVRTKTGEEDILSRNIVLASGAEESRDILARMPVAGELLLPRFASKLLLSSEILAEGGAAEAQRRLSGLGAPRVAIFGGSHSALAAANVLLSRCPDIDFEPRAITVIHRRPLRVFYPSPTAALQDGYTDFDRNDVCPVSGRLFRLAGFRLETRELVMRVLGIGRRPPEPRLRLHRLVPGAEAETQRVLEQADLVITALGYRARGLPLYDGDGQRIPLAADSLEPRPLVDGMSRVLDANHRPIPHLLGIGLAAGFVPSGPLGGEPSFRGQTNGIWLWQNGVGAMIIDALLSEGVQHVAA